MARWPEPTNRLRFRTWTLDDLPLALRLWGDPRVTAWIGGPLDIDGVRARLNEQIAMAQGHGVQYWPIFARDGGEHVGCCGLRPREDAVFEIGFHLHAERWHAGLAAEAATAVIAHAFGVLHAHALFAGHHPDNRASQALLTRLGFRYTHDEPFAATGRMHRSYRLERAPTG